LVADELAAAAGEDRWTVCEAPTILLASFAKSYLTRRLFGSTVRRIGVLAVPMG